MEIELTLDCELLELSEASQTRDVYNKFMVHHCLLYTVAQLENSCQTPSF